MVCEYVLFSCWDQTNRIIRVQVCPKDVMFPLRFVRCSSPGFHWKLVTVDIICCVLIHRLITCIVIVIIGVALVHAHYVLICINLKKQKRIKNIYITKHLTEKRVVLRRCEIKMVCTHFIIHLMHHNIHHLKWSNDQLCVLVLST